MSQRQKIVIIDDSPVAIEWVRGVLEDAGFQVIYRTEPLGSSLVVFRETPDLILVDISMPALDGLELVGMLRRNLSFNLGALVLYSDRPEVELSRLAMECKADGYIRKGTASDLFLSKVRELLPKRKP